MDTPILSLEAKTLTDGSGDITGLSSIFSLAKERELEEVREVATEARGIDDGNGKLPCVVFTHGMSGMSQSYSHYLGSMASHGIVVAAIEHRDGSGPGTIIHFPSGKERTVWHLMPKDFKAESKMTKENLQFTQLAFRQAEIEETIRFFHRLDAGDGEIMQNLKPKSPQSTLAGFKSRLNTTAITIVGHSYGATGALQALRNAPSESMPINGAVMLDPGKESGRLNSNIDLPILIMHSGAWTENQVEFYGEGWHFDVVKRLAKSVKTGWFMTLGKFYMRYSFFFSSDMPCSWYRASIVYRRPIDSALDNEDSYSDNSKPKNRAEGIYQYFHLFLGFLERWGKERSVGKHGRQSGWAVWKASKMGEGSGRC